MLGRGVNIMWYWFENNNNNNGFIRMNYNFFSWLSLSLHPLIISAFKLQLILNSFTHIKHLFNIFLEAKIGLFTDVAGGYFLSRLENNIGYYLGLTGQRLTGKELVQAGLADYYVKSENLQSLERALLDGGANVNSLQDAKKIVEGFHEPV